MRIEEHPILGPLEKTGTVTIEVDGKKISAYKGEMIASALTAAGIKVFRYTDKKGEPRGVFCAIGRCTDCMMEVNGRPNVRTCSTIVEDKMIIRTQYGSGEWLEESEN